MKRGTKVRLTFAAGLLIGALGVFQFGADKASAPDNVPNRLIEPAWYVENDSSPCPVELTNDQCRLIGR